MIFIAEKMGRPKGSKNKWVTNKVRPLFGELTKEEQRIFDILSTFAQKGFFDFTTISVDNEGVMKSEDQELISLYTELASTIKNRENTTPDRVIFKLYRTFSDMDILDKSQEFTRYLRNQGYDLSTINDIDIPKDQVKKLYKDFESLPPKPEPTVSKPSSDERDPITGRKKYTKRTPDQKKQDVVMTLTRYLKNVLKLGDDEIKSRVDLLLSPTQTSNDDEDTSTLNEQILKDFKRFL